MFLILSGWSRLHSGKPISLDNACCDHFSTPKEYNEPMSTPRPQPLLFEVQRLVVDLALIDRNHHLAGHERHENDIEHSFTVAMLCWLICDQSKIALNLEKILKYALIHDFVERYAGDVNAFAPKEERDQKVELERAALDRLSSEFKDFGGLVAAMHDYEARADEEALFVWTVDKMQAYIMGDLDSWRPYKTLGISYERFVAKHAEQLAVCSPYAKEIFEALLAYCKTTFYDQPKA